MNLQDYLTLGFSTLQDAVSWALLASIAAKVASTLVLLFRRHVRAVAWIDRHAGGLWWITKLSALAICAFAALLCRAGHDLAGERAFLALLAVATVLVVVRVRRRRAGHSFNH